MTKVRIAFAGTHLRAFHPESAIGFLCHVRLLDRFGETRPASAAVEFVERTEERFTADNIDINPVAVLVPIGIAEWWLGSAHLRHVILLGRQFVAQFGVRGFRGLFAAGRWSDHGWWL